MPRWLYSCGGDFFWLSPRPASPAIESHKNSCKYLHGRLSPHVRKRLQPARSEHEGKKDEKRKEQKKTRGCTVRYKQEFAPTRWKFTIANFGFKALQIPTFSWRFLGPELWHAERRGSSEKCCLVTDRGSAKRVAANRRNAYNPNRLTKRIAPPRLASHSMVRDVFSTQVHEKSNVATVSDWLCVVTQ